MTARNSEPTTFEDIVTPKPTVHLDQWTRFRGPYGEHLTGYARDHPNFLPDTRIHTTTIVADPEWRVVETRNTRYLLGTPATEGDSPA